MIMSQIDPNVQVKRKENFKETRRIWIRLLRIRNVARKESRKRLVLEEMFTQGL